MPEFSLLFIADISSTVATRTKCCLRCRSAISLTPYTIDMYADRKRQRPLPVATYNISTSGVRFVDCNNVGPDPALDWWPISQRGRQLSLLSSR